MIIMRNESEKKNMPMRQRAENPNEPTNNEKWFFYYIYI